jgi:Na+/H+-dicarboxylate symporter
LENRRKIATLGVLASVLIRGLANMIGNGVATLVVALWENELVRETLKEKMT